LNKYENLLSNFISSISDIKQPVFDEIIDTIEKELKKLYIEGKIVLNDDYALQHSGLEIRVEKVFKDLGFNVSPGRAKNLEDFIIEPQRHFSIQSPLVIEVKSGKHQYIPRDDLRQLDDWVFELSGEEKDRKGDTFSDSFQAGWINGESAIIPKQYKHPTPHKGVMVYNGPVGTLFKERSNNCINPNDSEFVNKRFFCIIPFHILVSCFEKLLANEIEPKELWEKIHRTSGLLEV
jgi:hypothetical protein